MDSEFHHFTIIVVFMSDSDHSRNLYHVLLSMATEIKQTNWKVLSYLVNELHELQIVKYKMKFHSGMLSTKRILPDIINVVHYSRFIGRYFTEIVYFFILDTTKGRFDTAI